MSISIGFTGTRQGMTVEQKRVIERLLRGYAPITSLHHGDAIGADEQFHNIALKLGLKNRIVIHPPDIDLQRAHCKGGFTLRPLPYLVRDHDIVDATQKLLATPKAGWEELRSGTWATIRYARKSGRLIVIVWPEGTVESDSTAEPDLAMVPESEV